MPEGFSIKNESQNLEVFILSNLHLEPIDSDSDIYELSGESEFVLLEKKEEKEIVSTEDLVPYFSGITWIKPDKLRRPEGDTTLFTTAGVQHVETILRKEGDLAKKSFAVSQPVIRSQYMDKVRDGFSTAFINFSVVEVDSSIEEFTVCFKKFLHFLIDRGLDPKLITFKVETIPDKWGNKSFTKTVLTILVNDVEVGEGVLMHDYPVDENKKVEISDICMGVERFNWIIAKSEGFFHDFKDFYSPDKDRNQVTAAIDCIRTAVLIAGEGVEPSHVDPGFRLRRLSKKFVQRNRGIRLDEKNLIELSLKYWRKWEYIPEVDENKVLEIIQRENTRNFNNMIFLLVEEKGGRKIHADINQPTENLVKQLRISLSGETKLLFENVLSELDIK